MSVDREIRGNVLLVEKRREKIFNVCTFQGEIKGKYCNGRGKMLVWVCAFHREIGESRGKTIECVCSPNMGKRGREMVK